MRAKSIDLNMWQVCLYHDSSPVVTWANLQPDWIIRNKIWGKNIFTCLHWAFQPLATWVPAMPRLWGIGPWYPYMGNILFNRSWLLLRCLCRLLFILNYRFMQFWFCNSSPPGMFLPLDLLLECWIEHVTIGPQYVKLVYSTGEFQTLQLIVLEAFGALD